MSNRPGPHRQLADIARQARALLGRVHESRWPGFEPPEAQATPRPTPAPSRKPAAPSRSIGHPGRPATRPAQPPARERPAPTSTPTQSAPFPIATTAAGDQLSAGLNPWNSLEEIAQAISGCVKCPLHTTRQQTVPGEGNAKARLLLVGEAPGADEDRLGRPFVGAAGQLLDKMIGAMGLERDRVFIANVLKCRPPGNRDPQEDEVAACLPYLHAQIDLIRPAAICTLGRHATHALLERKDSLGKMRGRFFEYRGTPLLPTFHPSYLLRTPADKNAAWKDLRQLMDLLGLPLPGQNATEAGDQ